MHAAGLPPPSAPRVLVCYRVMSSILFSRWFGFKGYRIRKIIKKSKATCYILTA